MTFTVVGIGEVLWDLLPGGRQLGGAPANFAYHARALGADARILSRVGDDADGRDLRRRLEILGLPTDGIEVDATAPTGTAAVEIAPDGQPHFTIRTDVAWDHLQGEGVGAAAIASADAVCFGTLAQRHSTTRATLRKLLHQTPREALRIFDVNLRQNHYTSEIIQESLELANVLKVNETELPRLAGLFGLHGSERSQISQISERHRLRAVAYTRGGGGSLLLANGVWSDHPGLPATVVDTVGAGDSFTAALALGLLAGWDPDAVNHRANEIAAWVASNAGATPALPEQLQTPFRTTRPGLRHK